VVSAVRVDILHSVGENMVLLAQITDKVRLLLEDGLASVFYLVEVVSGYLLFKSSHFADEYISEEIGHLACLAVEVVLAYPTRGAVG